MDDLPLLPLHGRLVSLLPFTEADITERHVDWLNDPQVVRFSNQRFFQHTTESCRAYLRSFDNSVNRYYSIRRLEDGAPLGTITAYAAVHHGTVDLGILLGERSTWGMGFGLDAWLTLMHTALATKGVRKITGGTLACNHGMLRIFERAGMTCEAVRRAQEIVDSEPHDIVYYARFRSAD